MGAADTRTITVHLNIDASTPVCTQHSITLSSDTMQLSSTNQAQAQDTIARLLARHTQALCMYGMVRVEHFYCYKSFDLLYLVYIGYKI